MIRCVLVIGGTGLLGGAVARQLRADGFRVRVFTRDAARARDVLGDEFEYFEGDAADPEAVERALEGCGAVHVSLSGEAEAEGAGNPVEAG